MWAVLKWQDGTLTIAWWALIGFALLVIIAAVSAVARWVITAQAPSIAVLALVQLMHGATFGLTQVGTMGLMVHHVPPHIMARGQGSPRGRVLARAGLGIVSWVIPAGLVDEAVGDGLAWEMRVRSLPSGTTSS